MRKGFTLVETMMASGIMAMVVIAAVSSWLMFLYKSHHVNQQAMLDMDARKVVEKFRYEVRNAARETIMFYPEDREPYEALGFALAKDSDNDGLMDMDASGSNILWRETVVYHVWRGSDSPQMRRTVFENRNNHAEYKDYYNQMGTVVREGSGAGATLAGERASTSVMFENLFTGKLWHAEAKFDGFAPRPNTRESVNFGSLALGPGAHRVDMIITGKNPASAGRKLRLDQLSVGVSGWPMEAEFLQYSGAPAVNAFVGPNLAGAAYGLNVATLAEGDGISMPLYNDAIEEVEFIGAGRNVSLSNTVVRFDEEFNPADRPNGAFATFLDGQYAGAWQVEQQTADIKRSSYFYPTNCTMQIPVMGRWVTAEGYGPVFRVYKSLYNGLLKIVNPRYAIVATPPDGVISGPLLTTADQVPLQFYQNGVPIGEWSGCMSQAYVDLRPAETELIEQNATLMLIFEVQVVNYLKDRLTAFQVNRPLVPGCWMLLPKSVTGITGEPETGTGIPPPEEGTAAPTIVEFDRLPLLEAMAVGYADKGEYISHVYDTRSMNGVSKTIEWQAEIPFGCDLKMYARSGDKMSDNGFEIEDAPVWGSAGEVMNGGSVPGDGRYVQFRVVSVAQENRLFPGSKDIGGPGPFRSDTPRLHRVLFKWDGEEKYIDVTGRLLKNPDCGIFTVEVDGKPLIRGVTMVIEIFKDINTMGNRQQRLRSSMMAEVEPRNSKKN